MSNELTAADREAVAVAHDSRIVSATERAASTMERAWRTSIVHRAMARPLAAFGALSPRDRISFAAAAIGSAALTHLVLRLL